MTLKDICQKINPEPESNENFSKLSLHDQLNKSLREVIQSRPDRWIKYAAYSGIPQEGVSSAEINIHLEHLKSDLRRVYETIRQRIGEVASHLSLLYRYKNRCEWYNREPLRAMIPSGQDKEEKIQKEHILTRDLALFSFDQGVPVQYQAKLGNHELDLLEMDVSNPMLIEVKVYSSHSVRANLIAGIWQFHSYLSRIEAWKKIHYAYYIYYRLGGPIYEFPTEIKTPRFIFKPILIDIAESKESGSHQQSPIFISEEAIFKEKPDDL